MHIYCIAEKPPCEYCDRGLPHGGGIINTALIFSDLWIEILMPYCNYTTGRTATEIVNSIFDANPGLRSLTPGIPLWRKLVDYLNLGNYRAYC